MWAVVIGAVALFAPHLTLGKSGVANEDYTGNVAASKSPNEKIAMVIDTLEDILQSIMNEEAQEAAIYDKYMRWCNTESSELAKDISQTETALGNAKALSEEQISIIDSLTLFLKRSEKEIEETKDSIDKSDALRNDEHEQYAQDMQLNTESLDQIELAIKHVGNAQGQAGLLQNGVTHKLQFNQPGESSYVMGIMKGLRDKIQKSRTLLRDNEEDKVKMHNSFLDTKGRSMKTLTETSTDKKIMLTETSAKESGVKQKIERLGDELPSLLDVAKKTHEQCQSSQKEWEVRQADRANEKAALDEAIHYLHQLSLSQISSISQHAVKEGGDQPSVIFSPKFLQIHAGTDAFDSDSSFEEAANAAFLGDDSKVADHMQKETFNGVKDVVSKLISTHLAAQQKEKSKADYCEKEIEAKKDEGDETFNALNEVGASIERKESEFEILADEVRKLYASIDDIRTSLETAGEVRKEENHMFEAGSKDRALALEVLNKAMAVLQKFYETKAVGLMHDVTGSSDSKGLNASPAKWSPGSSRKEAASFGALSLVQDIADDIAKEQKDADKEEKQAEAAFVELQQDSKQSMDDKQQDITDRMKAKAKLGVQINTLKETETEKYNDLNSIDKQLSALHKECDELLHFYDKRKDARDFEVAQLKDTMDILSGSSIAARTGFLQLN